MVLLRSIFSSLVALATLCVAKSSTGNRVLVVIEPTLNKNDYFGFFSSLESRGYELTFRAPKDERPSLVEYNVPNYDHVVLFAPTTKSFSSDLSPQNIVSLLQHKINILIALSPTLTPLHSLSAEFGLLLPPPDTPLLSHFPARSGVPTTLEIPITHGPNSGHVIPKGVRPIIYEGVNFALGNNPMIFPILSAPAESFASDTTKDEDAEVIFEASGKGGEGLWAGSQMAVVAGFQSKSGGRVVITGGVEMFSDKAIKAKLHDGAKSGNHEAVERISEWAFQETGVLRIDSVEHHRVGEKEAPEMYTINDEVVYTLTVSKYHPQTANWQPYPSINDMQLELTMLDPHIRTSLHGIPGQPGKYSATLRVPDRHGVFKFIVDYRRRGYSILQSAVTVPIVPPRHDQYPRFLSAAWPYYVGAISTSAGFVLFTALYLGGAVEKEKKAE